MELSNEDLTILDEALDAWITKDAAGELLGGMLTAMLTKDDPEAKAKMEREEEKRKVKAEENKAKRKRQATILKAKLYELSASMEANGAIEKYATRN